MIKNRDEHVNGSAYNGLRFLRQSGLQARMTISYVWVTIVAAFVLQGLNVVLLTGSINYALSHEKDLGQIAHFPSLATYPLQAALVMMMLVLLVAPLIGAWFGTMTTQKLVRRVQYLVRATTQVANGNYAYHVRVTQKDEIGQLEEQFNRMAEQLIASIAKREELAKQNARFAERARISRELHDAISQDLFSLHIIAGGLQADVEVDSLMYLPIMTLKQTTATLLREMRILLLELRPTQLERLGLVEALEDVAATYRTRLGISVTTKLTYISLPPQTEHALLRITQEALSNTARHADATIITVELTLSHNATVALTITDNGNGFEPDTSETQYGLGLHVMQERVQELNGTFALHTLPGQGTRIHVCLPQERTYDSHSHC